MSETTKDFVADDEIVGKTIKSSPAPEINIGVDNTDSLLNELAYEGIASSVSMSDIAKFTQVSQRREDIYQLIDSMCQDPVVAAVLETYAEDATEYNSEGHIMWVESSNPEIAKFVSTLLDYMNIDKNAFSWVCSMCKYGDLYLRLYRESDTEDEIFSVKNGKEKLNEDIRINAYSQNDKFTTYVEKVPNPAEMFELTKFGKTYGFVQAPVNTWEKENAMTYPTYRYSYNFRQKDIDIYGAKEFVHACLDNNLSRIPEEVNISALDKDDEKYKYSVKRGQSIFQSVFKIWRELMLLKNSVLLNRVTKSAILRIVSVEVADMPKTQVEHRLRAIKSLMEQKTAFNQDNDMSEYTNPGPIENNIYIPTRGGQGRIETTTVGGDVDVKGLADLDFFNNEFYGAMRVPKQYMGFTDDGAGFNGGQSLSIISSRYAKMIKRIQNAFIQAITDAVNILLIDRDLDNYINKFTLHMTPPTTQEELDRRDNIASNISLVRDVMQILESNIEDKPTLLKIEKSLLSNVLTNTEVVDLMQDEIDRLENENAETNSENTEEPELEDNSIDIDFDRGSSEIERRPPEENISTRTEEPEENSEEGNEIVSRVAEVDETELPHPSDLNIDFADNEQTF